MKRLGSVFLLMMVAFIFLHAPAARAELLRRDDFRDAKNWWAWENIGGGVRPSVGNGLITLRMNYGVAGQPSDSAIWNGENIYGNCTITLRAKALTAMKPGTIGWGLWNYNGNWASFTLAQSEIAWFMKQYDPYDSSRTWWGAWTRKRSTGNNNFSDLSQVDTGEWHTYRIERDQNYVSFYVDGQRTGYYQDHLPDGLLGFHLWIDNYNYPFNPYEPVVYRGFSGQTVLVMDFIEIHDGQLGSSEPAAGSVLLKERPNEAGTGSRNYLWKNYDFDSPGGKSVILITARAETYAGISNDDDIRIVIDDQDLGWDTPNSFDGDASGGANRTLLYASSLTAGEHTLQVHADISPILYDVTVIGSADGDILLSEEVNEKAPGGADYLWKEYTFECLGDEEVVVFISASAHENSGDDDDLRIVLDDENFGWNTANAFSGQDLRGEAKALTIRRNLPSGSHRLRIYADATPILHDVVVYGLQSAPSTNRPPELQPVGDKSINEGERLEFTVTATDPDDDELTFSAGNLPPEATFDEGTQTFSWIPSYGQADSYTNVLFNVVDNGDPLMSDSESITITVGDVNRPPVLGAVGNRSVDEGELLEFTVTATDPDGDALTFSAGNRPPGATFDAGTQTFRWIPSYGQADTYPNVLFSVVDNGDPLLSDSESITINVGDVNGPPELDPVGNKSVNEGELLEFTVTATDPDDDELTFSAVDLPPEATFDAGTQTFSWTPSYGQAGSYPDVLFKVVDNGVPSKNDSETITITVGDVNRPPVLGPIGNRSVNEGALLEFTVTATDPDDDALTYAAGSLPTGATFDEGSQTFRWTPSQGQAGSYPGVLFNVGDNGDPPMGDSETITITVGDVNGPPELDPIGNKSANEGVLLEFTVTATDPDDDELTFSAGNRPPGATFDGGSQTFRWTPSDGQAGSYPNVLFNVVDNGDPLMSDSESITITVGEGNRPPVLGPIGTKSVNEGALLEFTATASDPDGDELSFSAEGLPAGATFYPETQTFGWSPGYDQAGNHNVLFRVADDGTPSLGDFESITITVGDVNRPPVLAPIGTKSVNEGALLEFTVTATDPDGDELTFFAGNLPPGATFNEGSQIFSWTPADGQAGFYSGVGFNVLDNGSPPATDSEVITVEVEGVSEPQHLFHVSQIDVTTQVWWIIWRGGARVQIVDGSGSPVEGATVTGQWSGGASNTSQATTGSDGWATIYSQWRWGSATFGFCVTDVSKGEWEYDPEANLLSCDSSG